MNPRKIKKTDNKHFKEAWNHLMDIIYAHPHIEHSIWCSAMTGIFLNALIHSKCTLEQLDEILKNFRMNFEIKSESNHG